ncbi:MAG TPA: hypothetical protein GXX37_02280 [Clostridiaceae bacterium]|nr:hypothetical protein [Clostridiaceae bacterium]
MFFNKSHFKSLILAVLVISSFVQIGILWYNQNHSFPFNFLKVFSRVIEDRTEVMEKARKEIYKPYRLTVSNGNASHWLIEENSELKYELFKEVNEYLKDIFNTSGGIALDSNLWSELIIKKGILVEFKTQIKTDLLKWFLNNQKGAKVEFDSIYKILMVPDEDINNNNTIYLLTSKGLYKYVIPFGKDRLSRKDYSNIISSLELNRYLPVYKMFKEANPNNVISYPIPSDALCMISSSSYIRLPTIEYNVETETVDIEKAAAAVLGNEKESYDRYIEKNALVFKNINNIYRLYNDGLLEYKYVPGAESGQKGSISDAFINAYFFINRIKDAFIDAENGIYISKIKDDNPDYYEFVFDYMAGDYPVYINFDEKGNDNKPLKNAITIKANSKRIIECTWYIINIQKSRILRNYNIRFQDLLNGLVRRYGKEAMESYNIRNTTIAYVIDNGRNKSFSPVWIVENPEGEYYYVSLDEK